MSEQSENGRAAADDRVRVPRQRAGAPPVDGAVAEVRIRLLTEQGASPATIAAALNADGLPTPLGRRWHHTSVAKIVRGEALGDRSRRHTRLADAATLLDRAELLLVTDQLLAEVDAGTSVTLLVLDIDGFRHLNSAFGHPTGDAILRQLAERLCGLAAGPDVVARTGGDSFAVLSVVPEDDAAVERLLRDVQSATTPPFRTSAGSAVTVTVTVTVGAASTATGATSAAELLRNAELAMYRAKVQHHDWETYRADLDEPDAAALIRATELRAAIAAGQLTVHYQPIVDLQTGLVHSVEALARWAHPERGLVPPDEFLPLAERFDLMGEVTDAVLMDVTVQLRAWAQQGCSLPCAINLSATCLTDPRCSERLIQALIDLSGSITVEVVESVMADVDTVRVLRRLADAGVGCAIDDFGTGFSSLASLKTLPADTLKIDRGLLQDIETDSRDFAVVLAVVGMARSFEMQVVGEGIETEAAAVRLREAGVELGQGFWFGRPMPADQLERWLIEPPRLVPDVIAAVTPDVAGAPCDHAVLLRADEEDLMGEAARFLVDGLAEQGRAIAVVTAEHREALLAALPPRWRPEADPQGRLLVLDARETLQLFMRNGAPDPALFDSQIGSLVRERLQQAAGLRAYGEMVAVLWEDGNVVGALALEDLWNALQQETPFALLCAYPFAALQQGSELAQVCHRHDVVSLSSSAEPAPGVNQPLQLLLDSTRELLRVGAAEQAVGVLIRTVGALGGSAVPATLASPGALPIDISLGHADPVLPTAPLDSNARALLSALLPTLVEDAKVAADRAMRLAALSEEVDTDALTGLFNRRGLLRVRNLTGSDCVVMIDLDRFKEINDELGHDAGDRVLVAFSRAARQHLRSSDILFRLGGDEFLVVLPDTTTEDAARVIDGLRQHWQDERPLPVSFSAGIAPVIDDGFEESMRAADAALYEHKRSRRASSTTADGPA